MDLHLLGPTEALLDGRRIALGPRKQRAVLAMLALRLDETVGAERLAEGLWGDTPPQSAPKMVQAYVSHLRRALDGNGAAIATRGSGYELRLDGGDVDALRFERLVAGGRPREALALWRGDALADVADEPFAAPEIRRLEELRASASEAAVEADLAAGRHAGVIAELHGLVAAHPLRERLHALRMLALYRCGRQSEALAAYRVARATLVEQIGVEPGPELHRLHDAVLRHDPALDLVGTPDPATPAAPRPPPPRRRWQVLAAGAALLAAAGLAALGATQLGQPERLPRIGEDAVGMIDPADGRIAERHAVGHGPAAITAGGGSLWTANALDGTVSRIGRARDEVVSIDVGGEPSAVAYGAGSLWVADGSGRTVAQVDPGANRVVQRLPAGNAPNALAAGFGALWLASAADGRIRRIDLADADRVRSTALAAGPTAIAAGAGAVCVASEEAGTVSRLDPRTGALTRPINVGNGPSAIAAGAGGVWVVNRLDGTLSRIDPATGAVAWTASVGVDPIAVAAGDEGVWVAGGDESALVRIDPATGAEADRVAVGSSVSAIVLDRGVVWAAAVAPQAHHRGGTLRVLSPVTAPGTVPIDWLTEAAYSAESNQVLSLAYDGLVAYRRVSGAAGATIVGALATHAPRPADGGRTYRFTLRPGLRYSDGGAVRASDFRASLERFLQVTRGDILSPLYRGIAGARRCMTRAGRCDLSAGIETDDRARTIAVHLTRPDAEFLHKLTFQFAYVVPAATPRRHAGDRPPPGTGPYRIAAWDRRRGGLLVRNPAFRAWSPRSRPAGFADRIAVEVRGVHDPAAQLAAVGRGAADVAVAANLFTSLYPPERLDALAVRAPGRLRRHTEGTLNYMFLNVRRPPFADVRVRRALNLAVDRRRIVALEGGPALAVSTCQILPAAFPGHEPYCPYTARPGPGRPWTAPDLARAGELVAASGTAGERVVVVVPGFQRDLGRYFARLLTRLDYRAALRVLPVDPYFDAIYDPASRIQIGFNGWFPDYASPSTFFEPNFDCAAANLSHFCDHGVARRIDRALGAHGAEATTRWAAVDRRVTDLAPAVPLTNRRSAELVSERVGNVQHHVRGITLLDQLWVR